ncbi:MAG: VWD domain-containing protein [Parvularculaceae bacterium]
MSYSKIAIALALGALAVSMPASAQTGANNPLVKPSARPPLKSGDIGWPRPTKGDGPDGRPGCLVNHTRAPGTLGPTCALICKKSRTWNVQAACNSQPEGSWGVFDEAGNRLPDENLRSGEYDCEFMKGYASEPGNTTAFFPNGHPRCFGVRGDPHLKSFDGQRFDLQSAGEFVVAKSMDDDFEVQARFEPYTDTSLASVTTAVAVMAGGYRITVNREAKPALNVNGAAYDLSEGDRLTLPDAHAMILRRGATYSIVLADDTNVHISLGDIINFNILLAEARDGCMIGIGGDGDGERSNDFATADGERFMTPISHDDAHGPFAQSWRVTTENSLFEYKDGEAPSTFVIAGFPEARARLDDLDLAARARAETACRDGGLTDPALVEECVVDFALTGDQAFIASALSQQDGEFPPAARVDGQPEIIAPATGFAAHRLRIAIRGPVTRGYRLGFSPEGAAAVADVRNPYSATILNGGETEVTLAAPAEPGVYELRYGDARGAEAPVIASVFTAVAPVVDIDAPATASAGAKLEAFIAGDVGEHMQLVIVPVDADATANGSVIDLKQGGAGPVVFDKLPETPGAYEIRCVSNWHGGRTIYARRPLTIE